MSHETMHATPADLALRDVEVGQDCVISTGVHLAAHSRIGSRVFVGPNAVIGGRGPDKEQGAATATVIEDGAYVGALAYVAAGIRVGSNATVMEGAIVTRSVPPNAIVAGNPAYIQGYSTHSAKTDHTEPATASGHVESHDSITRLPVFADIRGALTVGNFTAEVPFEPARFFMVYGVPSRETRGEHAHKECHQFLICVAGSCRVLADDGFARRDILLDAPSKGLHLPPMTWGTQYDYSQDAVLLVFASHPYDADEYIRTYGEFIDAVNKKEQSHG